MGQHQSYSSRPASLSYLPPFAVILLTLFTSFSTLHAESWFPQTGQHRSGEAFKILFGEQPAPTESREVDTDTGATSCFDRLTEAQKLADEVVKKVLAKKQASAAKPLLQSVEETNGLLTEARAQLQSSFESQWIANKRRDEKYENLASRLTFGRLVKALAKQRRQELFQSIPKEEDPPRRRLVKALEKEGVSLNADGEVELSHFNFSRKITQVAPEVLEGLKFLFPELARSKVIESLFLDASGKSKLTAPVVLGETVILPPFDNAGVIPAKDRVLTIEQFNREIEKLKKQVGDQFQATLRANRVARNTWSLIRGGNSTEAALQTDQKLTRLLGKLERLGVPIRDVHKIRVEMTRQDLKAAQSNLDSAEGLLLLPTLAPLSILPGGFLSLSLTVASNAAAASFLGPQARGKSFYDRFCDAVEINLDSGKELYYAFALGAAGGSLPSFPGQPLVMAPLQVQSVAQLASDEARLTKAEADRKTATRLIRAGAADPMALLDRVDDAAREQREASKSRGGAVVAAASAAAAGYNLLTKAPFPKGRGARSAVDEAASKSGSIPSDEARFSDTVSTRTSSVQGSGWQIKEKTPAIDPREPDPAQLAVVRQAFGEANQFARRGGFGTVYDGVVGPQGLGPFRPGAKVAVKVPHAKPDAQAKIEHEGAMLSLINDSVDPHHRLIRGTYDPETRTVVMEALPGGSPLHEYLALHGDAPGVRARLRQQLLEAKEALRKANLVHGDLSRKNVLVSEGDIKIVDYGEAGRPGERLPFARAYTPGHVRESRQAELPEFADDDYAFDVLLADIDNLQALTPWPSTSAIPSFVSPSTRIPTSRSGTVAPVTRAPSSEDSGSRTVSDVPR